MDQKKSPNRRSKRQSKLTEESHWDCSVCTYRNSAEAFKCMMCDVRKGTSTRKPRINPQLVAQQVAQQYTQIVPKVKKESSGKSELANVGGGTNDKPISKSEKKSSSSSEGKCIRKARPKLKNVDRSSAEHKAVTVNNVTVIITEFQPKRHPPSLASSESSIHGGGGGCSGTENGNHSDSTNHSGDSHSDGRSS